LKLKVLDLFAGIGGFSLGLERTGGFETVAFCEIDKKAQKVLKKHWPDIPVFDDVKGINAETLNAIGVRPDVVTGGFPCQDISTAGKGAGLAGERSGLWFEMLRIIKETRPQYAIIENVSALRSRGLEVVLGGLAEIGYDAEWHCIPASAVGAPHKQRDRIWIVAYPECQRGRSREHTGQHAVYADTRCKIELAEADRGWWAIEPSVGRLVDGFPGRLDRLKQLGNAVIPQFPELIGTALLRHNSLQGATVDSCRTD